MGNSWFITGANRGLGLEFVCQLLGKGETVIAACRHPETASELRKLSPTVLPLTVTDEASCAACAKQLQGVAIDVLVNNAGVSSTTNTLASVTLQSMLDAFAVNSVGPLLVTKALLPNIRAGKLKRLVSISSQLGSIANNSGGSTYAYRASKAAINQITRSLAHELKSDGITCVAMHPGWVKTDMGGPNAPLTPAQSVSAMLKTIESLSAQDTGRFINYDGANLPW